MTLAIRPLRFYIDGAPVLVGRYDGFTELHPKMNEVILAEHRGADYSRGHNFAIESSEPCFHDLYSIMLESVCRFHARTFGKELSISTRNKRTCWAYVLDENRPSVGIWHNHAETSTYNAVYYPHVSRGDAIEVIVPNDFKDLRVGREVEVPVEDGMLLVMPGWLFHKEKPIERRAGTRRISINMEVVADQHSDVALFFAIGWR